MCGNKKGEQPEKWLFSFLPKRETGDGSLSPFMSKQETENRPLSPQNRDQISIFAPSSFANSLTIAVSPGHAGAVTSFASSSTTA